MTGAAAANQLISIHPEELNFLYELDKQIYCDLKITNNKEQTVAFKVKTTSPKKYFVRPNTGILQPWDSCFIRVTLQAQQEYPPDMQCKDKFLLQSTIVSQHTELDQLPPDTFTKEGGKTLEDCKLKVVYTAPASRHSEDEAVKSAKLSPDSNSAIQHLRNERDAAFQQTQQLQQELEMLKRRRQRKNDAGFSFKFAILVGFIGVMVGFLLNLIFTSPSVEYSSALEVPID